MGVKVFLGIGSNVGNRIGYILRALEELRSLGRVLRLSTVYESEAWGYESQRPFLNLVVLMETKLLPHELLLGLRRVERKVGRKERFKWGPREIDIDVLLYGQAVINYKLLTVPHPYLCERDFFLYPLLEVEENAVHPLYGKPLREFSPENRLRPFCCIRDEIFQT
ncbi:MAG: 2-amino-4-hydroxy-6-hydroxymethyldihydropteridine diphosphokinase [Aquificae bacterium]|nr:2-amino-4-hydroxy-6-hydroxymethyldihydropteridine diphosphokinase [Aquificota bacterium]